MGTIASAGGIRRFATPRKEWWAGRGIEPSTQGFSCCRKPKRPGPVSTGPGPRLDALGLLSDLANVRGLASLRALGHFELDLVSFGQALKALGLDSTEVHEHVLAVLLGDKAIPFRIVEPFHASLSHFDRPLSLRHIAS